MGRHIENDNQYFRFEPVPNKADTYYIIAKITDQKTTIFMSVQRRMLINKNQKLH